MAASPPTSTLHDATLSKTLIEAKDRLGSVYFEARLIECPKNAIELKKLLRKYDILEKEYQKQISEVKRGQQMLSLSLTNYLKSDRPLSSQEIFSQSRSDRLTLPLPPGFRFRSNGEPKQVQLKSMPTDTDGRKCWENSVQWRKEQYAMLNAVFRETEATNAKLSDEQSNADKCSVLDEQRSLITLDSKTTPSLCNARFAFKPGSINFGKSEGKILKLGHCSRSSLRPACSACQFKLKYSDEGLQKMRQTQKEPLLRWQIPPQGFYVKAPFNFIELDRMVSEVHSAKESDICETQSAPSSLGYAAFDDHLPSVKDKYIHSCTENFRLASSDAFTTIHHTTPTEKSKRRPTSFVPCKAMHSTSGQKRSTVSFSPSTTDTSPTRSMSPPMAISGTTWDSNQTFLTGRTSSNYKSPRPQLSVEDWRSLLEEERDRCTLKVDRFLKKLPGSYTPSLRSQEEVLLPWARRKDQKKL